MLRQKLASDKEKLAELKKDTKKNVEECTKKIQNDKVQQINAVTNTMTRFYDAMIADVNYTLKEVDTQIDNDSVEIEENLGLLADIEENSKIVTSVEDIVDIMSTVNLVTENAVKFSGMKNVQKLLPPRIRVDLWRYIKYSEVGWYRGVER